MKGPSVTGCQSCPCCRLRLASRLHEKVVQIPLLAVAASVPVATVPHACACKSWPQLCLSRSVRLSWSGSSSRCICACINIWGPHLAVLLVLLGVSWHGHDKQERKGKGRENGLLHAQGRPFLHIPHPFRFLCCVICQELDAPDPFIGNVEVHAQVRDALQWQSARCWKEVNMQREAITVAIEARGKQLWKNGQRDAWFGSPDEELAAVVQAVNGPLFHELIGQVEPDGPSAASIFKEGAQLFGELECAGIGTAVASAPCGPLPAALKQHCLEHNRTLLATLKRDRHAGALLEITRADAELGRMSVPVPVSECDLESTLLHPRFAVEQGLKADGTCKLRPIDNFSWSAVGRGSKKKRKAESLNGHCFLPEKVQHDHLDSLVNASRMFLEATGEVPALWKADVDAAFRRVPLRPHERWAAAVVFKEGDQVWVSQHYACPFGAAGSVYGWERVGHAVVAIIRKLLHMAVFRYVDDFFAPERQKSAGHALGCFARIVRAILGDFSLAARKLEHGTSLVVLGVELHMSRDTYFLRPSRPKVEKCIAVIKEALGCGVLHRGAAQKLAGRLSWSTQFIFHKLGRAMLRPIFTQKFARDGRIASPLGIALRWWLRVLELDIVEDRSWHVPELPPARLFVDARSTPPRCAAVLFIDGVCLYSDGKPHDDIMQWFYERADGQITSLEILAISMGLSTFAAELAGRKVVVYSDNTGAEVRRFVRMCVCTLIVQHGREQSRKVRRKHGTPAF